MLQIKFLFVGSPSPCSWRISNRRWRNTAIAGASGSCDTASAQSCELAGLRTPSRDSFWTPVSECADGSPDSRRRIRLMYEVRLVALSTTPASSSNHWRMVLTLCPSARAVLISGHKARIWPAFVAGFSARRRAKRFRVAAIQFRGVSVCCRDRNRASKY